MVCNCIHELLNVFEDSAQREHTIGMGNYSIIVIIVIILLAMIDILYFSLTNDNQNWQLLCNNHGGQRNICKFSV